MLQHRLEGDSDLRKPTQIITPGIDKTGKTLEDEGIGDIATTKEKLTKQKTLKKFYNCRICGRPLKKKRMLPHMIKQHGANPNEQKKSNTNPIFYHYFSISSFYRIPKA